MNLKPKHLFFATPVEFSPTNRTAHEEHHARFIWVYYSALVLGFWLIAGPSAFGYTVDAMIWNDIISGIVLLFLSYKALKPYNLWAKWGIVFLGIWLMAAPMLFWAETGAGQLSGFLIGTLLVAFGILIPGQPGIKLIEQPGPTIPPGWKYNPSSWPERIPVIFLAWVGFFIARYMGALQLGYIDEVWDPFFGDGTYNVLTSDVSHSFPVSDASLGAFSYLLDVLFGYAGSTNRWRTMPWVVIIFGILIIPLGVVSITLVILQPVAVGFWCTLCLSSAMISLIMIPFTVDEVLATVQLMRHEKKVRGTSYWTTLWVGGTMEGGEADSGISPQNLLPYTFRESSKDLLNRPWNLFLLILTGIWIMAAPSVLGYEESMANSNYITGALVITFAVISMSEIVRTTRFINFLLGTWLILAIWVIGTNNNVVIWNSVIVGLLLFALCIPKGSIEGSKGGFEKYIK